ncbi:ADP-heptose synthase [Elusimicrobium minutum Pei191]|uniref:ADP-heptose synthase n=1 Tax=Elusimicrobium minutum (strain Pei191) TaxID=445932 RepID=B2KD61_ELUMP|nr:D-glycero-beta-D-manno-heptose-7-phosphate kinase [Elusimicrobium minutum]ACC98457.1 ADP-heptose synthase [Elusimicrobium minutum Pei191]
MNTVKKENLKKFLTAFNGKEIIVVGDIMLDHFIKGTVSRISPEAPVPVVNVTKEYYVAGGAGNVAVNLAALGAKATILSVVGQDRSGEDLSNFLSGQGVDTSFVVLDTSRPTTQKIRILAENQQVVRYDRESKNPVSSDIGKICMENFKFLAKKADGVVISDYGKGMLSEANIKAIVDICNKNKIPVCVDPKIENFKKYKNITCMTPNTKEAFEGMGVAQVSDEKVLFDLGNKILKTLNAVSLLITRGAEGMSLFEKEKGGKVKVSSVKATAREVFDVTGAGDTVISVLTLALAAKASLKEAASLANYAAGIVVGKVGTATVTQQEILKVLK